MKYKKLVNFVIGKYNYDELSDYGKGVRDTLNLIEKDLNEHTTQEDIIKEIKRISDLK